MNCAVYCRLSKEDEEKVQESESIKKQKYQKNNKKRR